MSIPRTAFMFYSRKYAKAGVAPWCVHLKALGMIWTYDKAFGTLAAALAWIESENAITSIENPEDSPMEVEARELIAASVARVKAKVEAMPTVATTSNTAGLDRYRKAHAAQALAAIN